MPGLRITREQRVQIAAWYQAGEKAPQMAAYSGLHVSTIYRELGRNHSARHGPKHGGRERGQLLDPARGPREARGVYRFGYHAATAQKKADRRARRPRAAKLGFAANGHGSGFAAGYGWGAPTLLRLIVIAKLEARWSPQQIAGWLKLTFPHRPELHVSHETIYQAIYVQSRGNLRAELRDQVALRQGRTRRRGNPSTGGAVRSKRPWAQGFNISQRPAEVSDRALPGHWEGDLVIGKDGASALITLVERSTRYVLLGHLPLDRASSSVITVLSELAQRLPHHLLASLTWDNGTEMAQHAAFTVATGCPVFFADPHSPWQRGSNENTNGLLRQYYPRGVTDFRSLTQEDLDLTAYELNDRPRQTLGWHTPRQALQKVLLATAT